MKWNSTDYTTRRMSVLSLHRSEGFGLTIAEAMIRGIPVVATKWSGNVDSVTEENGVPVPYSLVPATDPQGTYDQPQLCWADADVAAAADALKRLRAEPELALRMGQAGASYAARNWSAQAYTDLVSDRLGIRRHPDRGSD